MVWIVCSGSFLRDIFEGIELKAGRQLVDEIRDEELNSGQSIRIGDEGKYSDLSGSSLSNVNLMSGSLPG